MKNSAFVREIKPNQGLGYIQPMQLDRAGGGGNARTVQPANKKSSSGQSLFERTINELQEKDQKKKDTGSLTGLIERLQKKYSDDSGSSKRESKRTNNPVNTRVKTTNLPAPVQDHPNGTEKQTLHTTDTTTSSASNKKGMSVHKRNMLVLAGAAGVSIILLIMISKHAEN